QILHLLRQGTTWKHTAILTKAQDVERADRIARSTGSARWTAIDPAVSAPLPAYRTCLRGIGFIEGNSASCLVVKLLDNLPRAGRAYLLRLNSAKALGGLVEGFTDIASRTRKRLCYLSRRLVAQIADTSLRLIQRPVFAPL